MAYLVDWVLWDYVHGQIEAMEVLLAGALRREKSFEAATKQMASEVKQLNSLVCTSCSKLFSSYVMEEQSKKSLMLVILEPNRKNWAKVIHTSLDLNFTVALMHPTSWVFVLLKVPT